MQLGEAQKNYLKKIENEIGDAIETTHEISLKSEDEEEKEELSKNLPQSPSQKPGDLKSWLVFLAVFAHFIV